MRSDGLTNITFRLRHLKAVYGRNFLIPKINPDKMIGVFFAVSPPNTRNLGYCFLSETSTNLKLTEGNILLFELELYFSGLVLLDFEMRDNPFLKISDNQVFIQIGSHIYAPRNYLKENEGLLISPINRSPQLSYGYNCILRFLINMESSRGHMRRMSSLKHSIDIMKDSLKKILDKNEKREELYGRMILLQNRLTTTNFIVSTSLSNSRCLSERLFVVDDKLRKVYQESAELAVCLEARLQSIKLMRNKITQVQQLLTLRATQMLTELDDIFSSEVICPIAGQCQESTLTESVNNRAPPLSNYRQQNLNAGYSFDSLFSSWSSSSQTDLNDPLIDLTNHPSEVSLKYSVESDLGKTTTALGYAAFMLTLMAVILDQPIVYPLDFTDGFCRTRIMDLMTPCITDSDRILPLYPTKTAAIPSYKNAVRLLLWNVISLRARFGLSTPSERSIAWSLKSLIDHFRLKDTVLD